MSTLATDNDDTVLIGRIARGESKGLSDLYDRYRTLVYSIAYHVLGNSQDAEEATLDVFGKIWEKAGQYEARKAKVRAWLASIARNRSIDMLRQRHTRFSVQSPQWSDACLECMPADDDSQTALETAVMQKTMADAMQRLPANQREALWLAYFKGMSHSQIAEALAQPLGTIKTRIRSALQTLKQIVLNEKEKLPD